MYIIWLSVEDFMFMIITQEMCLFYTYNWSCWKHLSVYQKSVYKGKNKVSNMLTHGHNLDFFVI